MEEEVLTVLCGFCFVMFCFVWGFFFSGLDMSRMALSESLAAENADLPHHRSVEHMWTS